MSREKRISAIAFGLAALAVAVVAVLASAMPNGSAWWATVVYPLPFAAMGAAGGVLAGPRLVRCRKGWEVAAVGLAVMVGSALAFVALAVLVVVGIDLAVGGAVTRLSRGDLGWLALYTTLSGVVVSPVGILAGWFAWRRLRRGRRRSVS